MINFPYYSFSQYLRNHFSFPVYKATIDAGFICPNMDGTKGVGGCTFCNNASFSPAFRVRKENIKEQLEINIARFLHARKKIANKNPKFLAFFQAFTGTYGPLDLMYSWWQEALTHKSIIGLSISTRADCINLEIMEALNSLSTPENEIWIEIGVESTHESTLLETNRGHTFQEVIEAVHLVQLFPNIKLCLHLIHGLPNESEEMMLQSVQRINKLNPTAIKFHHLEIVKDTVLAVQHNIKPIKVFSMEEYFNILGKSLQRLDKNIVIQRLFSHSPKEFLVAPIWKILNYNQLFSEYLIKNNITQGQLF